MRGRILDDIYEKLGLNRTAEAQRMLRTPEGRARAAAGGGGPAGL